MEAIRASRGMLGEPNNLSSLMDNGVQRPFSMKFIESMLPYGIATPDYCAEWHYGQADMHDVQMWHEEDLGARGLK
jgi:hypothetical protein